MTQPGSIIAPQPSWWVRTARVGTNTGTYGWAAAAWAGTSRKGSAAGSYTFSGGATGAVSIVIDNVSNGTHAQSSSITWTHTIGANTALLLVGTAVNHGVGPTGFTRSATCGTTAMTSLGVQQLGNVTGPWCELYALTDPPAGTQTITVTAQRTLVNAQISGASVSYRNATIIGSAVLSYGTATPITTGAIPSVLNGVAFALLTTPAGAALSSTTPTQRAISPGTATTNYLQVFCGEAPGTGSNVTMSAAFSPTGNWAAIGAKLVYYPIRTAPANFTSQASLAATSSAKDFTPGALSAAGALSVRFSQIEKRPAPLTANAALSAPAYPKFATAPALAGHGVLSARAFNKANPATFDATAISSFQNGTASGTPFTFSHTIASGAAIIVAVHATGRIDPTTGTGTVTCGGAPLTSLGFVGYAGDTGQGWVWVFGAPNMAPGTQTISVILTQGSNTLTGYASSYSYTNVAAIGTLQSATGNNASPALTATSSSTTGNRLWAAIGNKGTRTYSGFTLTARQTQVSNAPYFIAGDTIGAATVNVAATMSGNNQWAVAAVDLIG